RTQPPEERSLGSHLVEVERLRVEGGGKRHDLVRRKGVRSKIRELADLSVLKVKVRTEQARGARRPPKARDWLWLPLCRGRVGRCARATAAGELIGAPTGHPLVLLVEKLHERLANANVGSRDEVALLEHAIAAAHNIAGADRHHPPSLVHARGAQRGDA